MRAAICGETHEPPMSRRSSGLRLLPLASRVGCSIAQWLSPQFGENIRVGIDTDRIDALAADRSALWERVSNAAFLRLNEKREAVGYGPVAGGGPARLALPPRVCGAALRAAPRPGQEEFTFIVPRKGGDPDDVVGFRDPPAMIV
jgi:hypothetical protein